MGNNNRPSALKTPSAGIGIATLTPAPQNEAEVFAENLGLAASELCNSVRVLRQKLEPIMREPSPTANIDTNPAYSPYFGNLNDILAMIRRDTIELNQLADRVVF